MTSVILPANLVAAKCKVVSCFKLPFQTTLIFKGIKYSFHKDYILYRNIHLPTTEYSPKQFKGNDSDLYWVNFNVSINFLCLDVACTRLALTQPKM